MNVEIRSHCVCVKYTCVDDIYKLHVFNYYAIDLKFFFTERKNKKIKKYFVVFVNTNL